MAVNLSPLFNDAQLDSSGNPASGFLLYTYTAGSSNALTTYQDSAGSTPHSNPITLNSRGEPPAPIWLTAAMSYKFILKTAADVTVRTIDNVSGVNDSSVTIDEWVSSGLTPTYVSATSFTLAGDQTTAFHIGRKLKVTDGGGTKYVRITNSVFGALTTVTVEGDALATPTSAVSLGLIKRTNTSLPAVEDDELIIVDPADPTKRARIDVGSVTAGQTRVFTAPDADGTLITSTNPFPDTSSVVAGSADATKKIRIEADGLTTATTRVWTAPDKDITVAGISDISAANGASMVLLSSQTASASAAIDFNSVVTNTYDTYVLEVINAAPATDNVSLYLRGSTNNGSAFLAGTEYSHARTGNDTGAATPAGVAAAGVAQIEIIASLGNAANRVCSGRVVIHRSSGNRTIAHWQFGGVSAAGAWQNTSGNGIISTNDINALRLLMSSGNIASGTFRLYALKSS